MKDRMLAEWFWCDRWMGSSAFLLPLEARGLYREMLTQAWLRGARLPNDHEAVRRAIGATEKEWRRSWPAIERFWRVDGDGLVNDTQLEIYAASSQRSNAASTRGRVAASVRWGDTQVDAQASRKHQSKHSTGNAQVIPSGSGSGSGSKDLPPLTAPKKRPRFSGERIAVFDWQHAKHQRILGTNAEAFDLDGWYRDFDSQATRIAQVIPERDNGAWLASQLVLEAQRRGLTIATAEAPFTAAELSAAKTHRFKLTGGGGRCPHGDDPCEFDEDCLEKIARSLRARRRA